MFYTVIWDVQYGEIRVKYAICIIQSHFKAILVVPFLTIFDPCLTQSFYMDPICPKITQNVSKNFQYVLC